MGGKAIGGNAVGVLAIDQGTSATKALLIGATGAVLAQATAPVGRTTPQPGWVEQSASEILASVRTAVAACLDRSATGPAGPPEVVAVGLTNQRESLVLWDRVTGEPLAPVVSWQDQRGAAACDLLVADGHAAKVRAVSGLPLDPMFSATKAAWLLDRYDPDRRRSREGRVCLGTVDSWLLFHLTGEHVIEVGNASRTQLLDIHTGAWSDPLRELFGVPAAALGEVRASTGPYRPVRGLPPVPGGTPLAAVLGDSHAALFAHSRGRPGVVKATYGTGSSVMALADPGTDLQADLLPTDHPLCLTIAWDRGRPAYALEGNIRASGDTLVWLGHLLGRSPDEVARLGEASESDGVHLVPAFSGLGAPWWDRAAAGLVSGITAGAGPGQLARAALEAIAFQVEDVVAAVSAATGEPVGWFAADGGGSANRFLMRLQADLSGRRVRRSLTSDLSALGVAHLAGAVVGLWSDSDRSDGDRSDSDRSDGDRSDSDRSDSDRSDGDLARLAAPVEEIVPASRPEWRRARLAGWHAAVARARHY